MPSIRPDPGIESPNKDHSPQITTPFLLISIKAQKKLTKQIARLRLHPVPWYAFWRSSVFGPVHHNRVEVPDVFSTLEKLAKAASSAKSLSGNISEDYKVFGA